MNLNSQESKTLLVLPYGGICIGNICGYAIRMDEENNNDLLYHV
jgi:hypothetical protein